MKNRKKQLLLLAVVVAVLFLASGCSSPVAAYATVSGDSITLKGMYVTSDQQLYFETISGPRSECELLGARLAEQMRRKYQ